MKQNYVTVALCIGQKNTEPLRFVFRFATYGDAD